MFFVYIKPNRGQQPWRQNFIATTFTLAASYQSPDLVFGGCFIFFTTTLIEVCQPTSIPQPSSPYPQMAPVEAVMGSAARGSGGGSGESELRTEGRVHRDGWREATVRPASGTQNTMGKAGNYGQLFQAETRKPI